MLKFKLWINRGFMLSGAPIVEYLSRFGRTVVLSRFLTHEEFGISAAIVVLLGIVTLLADISLDKFVMQAGRDDVRTLETAHALSILRGILIAFALVVAAPAVAALFGVPHSTESFAVVGLYPLIAGFNHYRIKQIQRHYHYGSECIAQVAAFTLAFLAVFPALYFFKDHRVIIVSYFVEAGAYALASHLLAGMHYSLWSDQRTFRSALKFGLPLMANGIGLAVLSQLDRVIVGSWLGVATLANYTVILSLSVVPMSLVLRVFGPMAFSNVLLQKADPTRKDYQALLFFLSVLIATLYALFVAFSLDWLVPLIFGLSFYVPRYVHILLTAIIFLRMVRYSTPTVFLLVAKKTSALALLNLSAGFGFLFAFWLIRYRMNISSILVGLLVGEVISFGLFFCATYSIVSTQKHLLPVDMIMSVIALVGMVAVLSCNFQSTWQAHGAVLLVGLIGVSAQIAVGFRNHGISSLIVSRDEV